MSHETSAEQAKYYSFPSLPDLTLWQGGAEQVPAERHVHLTYQVGIVTQGAQRFWHRGAHNVLTADRIATFNPDEVHDSCSALPVGYRSGILRFSDNTLRELFGDSKERFFQNSLFRHEHVLTRLCKIFQCLPAVDFMASGERLAISESIRLIIGDLFQDDVFLKTTVQEARQCQLVKSRIKEQILTDPSEPLSLGELAIAVGFSEYQLIRHFKKTFGMTPGAYQLWVRLERSKEKLAAGHSIVDVAAQMGFTDQSHLTRNFRRAFFVTPGQYLREVR